MKEIKYEGHDLEELKNADNYYNLILFRIRKYLGKNILEVGGGSGTFSRKLLSTRPSKLITLEPSKKMFKRLKRNLQGYKSSKVINSVLPDLLIEKIKPISSSVYINVLEHIEDDRGELERVYELLDSDGHVCIYVPALPWLYGEFDRKVGHYRRYTKMTLMRVLEKAGFEIIELYYTNIFAIIPWWIFYVLLKKETISELNMQGSDKIIVPILRVLEKYAKPPIGSNLIAIGRKV